MNRMSLQEIIDYLYELPKDLVIIAFATKLQTDYRRLRQHPKQYISNIQESLKQGDTKK